MTRSRRNAKKDLPRKIASTVVAGVYLFTAAWGTQAAETNFWAERQNRRTPLLARAPSPENLLLAFPSPRPTAFMQAPVDRRLPRWLADAVAPHGALGEIHLAPAPGAPFVLHIQDLHDSAQAQQRTAALLRDLADRGVSLVGLEGAAGPFALEAFRAFPDRAIARRAAEALTNAGYLGGAELAGVTAARPLRLWGVEDMADYRANLDSVKNAARARPALDLFLQNAGTFLAGEKERIYSPALKTFDRHFTAYHLGQEPLGIYVQYLLSASPRHPRNLLALQEALARENKLDFKTIEAERNRLLAALTPRLSPQALRELTDRATAYRLNRITYGEFHGFLQARCREQNIAPQAYPALADYARYVLAAEQINRRDLLSELAQTEREVQNALAHTPAEKRLAQAGRDLGLWKRLSTHALTAEDWSAWNDDVLDLPRRLAALSHRDVHAPSAGALRPFLDFSRLALKRNDALVGNLLAEMKTQKQPSAVLVAGGFHTEGITRLLRRQNVSYAVVTPRVDHLPEGPSGLDLLARDPTPLEKLFAGERINLSAPRPLAPSNTGFPRVRAALALAAIVLLTLAMEKRGVDPSPDEEAAAGRLAHLPSLQGRHGDPMKVQWARGPVVVQVQAARKPLDTPPGNAALASIPLDGTRLEITGAPHRQDAPGALTALWENLRKRVDRKYGKKDKKKSPQTSSVSAPSKTTPSRTPVEELEITIAKNLDQAAKEKQQKYKRGLTWPEMRGRVIPLLGAHPGTVRTLRLMWQAPPAPFFTETSFFLQPWRKALRLSDEDMALLHFLITAYLRQGDKWAEPAARKRQVEVDFAAVEQEIRAALTAASRAQKPQPLSWGQVKGIVEQAISGFDLQDVRLLSVLGILEDAPDMGEEFDRVMAIWRPSLGLTKEENRILTGLIRGYHNERAVYKRSLLATLRPSLFPAVLILLGSLPFALFSPDAFAAAGESLTAGLGLWGVLGGLALIAATWKTAGAKTLRRQLRLTWTRARELVRAPAKSLFQKVMDYSSLAFKAGRDVFRQNVWGGGSIHGNRWIGYGNDIPRIAYGQIKEFVRISQLPHIRYRLQSINSGDPEKLKENQKHPQELNNLKNDEKRLVDNALSVVERPNNISTKITVTVKKHIDDLIDSSGINAQWAIYEGVEQEIQKLSSSPENSETIAYLRLLRQRAIQYLLASSEPTPMSPNPQEEEERFLEAFRLMEAKLNRAAKVTASLNFSADSDENNEDNLHEALSLILSNIKDVVIDQIRQRRWAEQALIHNEEISQFIDMLRNGENAIKGKNDADEVESLVNELAGNLSRHWHRPNENHKEFEKRLEELSRDLQTQVNSVCDLPEFQNGLGKTIADGVKTTAVSHFREQMNSTQGHVPLRGTAIMRTLDKIVSGLNDEEKNEGHQLAHDFLGAFVGSAAGHVFNHSTILVLHKDVPGTELVSLLADKNIVGIVAHQWTPYSHGAVVARGRGIPVVYLPEKEWSGIEHAALDSVTGEIFLNPNDETEKKLLSRSQIREIVAAVFKQQLVKEKQEHHGLGPARSKDGVPVHIALSGEDAALLIKGPKNGADGGVGLIRSEMITEEAYADPAKAEAVFIGKLIEIGEAVPHGPIHFRLIDKSGDKTVMIGGSPSQSAEVGLRYLLQPGEGRGVALDQLRAVILAAMEMGREIRVVVPMVSEPQHVEEIRALFNEAVDSLKERVTQKYPYPGDPFRIAELEKIDKAVTSHVVLSYMIETIGAMENAETFITPKKESGGVSTGGFILIGTNDLTSAILGVKRDDKTSMNVFQGLNPAVMEAIVRIARFYHNQTPPTAPPSEIIFCGELAQQEMFLPFVLALAKTFGDRLRFRISLPPGFVLARRGLMSRLNAADAADTLGLRADHSEWRSPRKSFLERKMKRLLKKAWKKIKRSEEFASARGEMINRSPLPNGNGTLRTFWPLLVFGTALLLMMAVPDPSWAAEVAGALAGDTSFPGWSLGLAAAGAIVFRPTMADENMQTLKTQFTYFPDHAAFALESLLSSHRNDPKALQTMMIKLAPLLKRKALNAALVSSIRRFMISAEITLGLLRVLEFQNRLIRAGSSLASRNGIPPVLTDINTFLNEPSPPAPVDPVSPLWFETAAEELRKTIAIPQGISREDLLRKWIREMEGTQKKLHGLWAWGLQNDLPLHEDKLDAAALSSALQTEQVIHEDIDAYLQKLSAANTAEELKKLKRDGLKKIATHQKSGHLVAYFHRELTALNALTRSTEWDKTKAALLKALDQAPHLKVPKKHREGTPGLILGIPLFLAAAVLGVHPQTAVAALGGEATPALAALKVPGTPPPQPPAAADTLYPLATRPLSVVLSAEQAAAYGRVAGTAGSLVDAEAVEAAALSFRGLQIFHLTPSLVAGGSLSPAETQALRTLARLDAGLQSQPVVFVTEKPAAPRAVVEALQARLAEIGEHTPLDGLQAALQNDRVSVVALENIPGARTNTGSGVTIRGDLVLNHISSLAGSVPPALWVVGQENVTWTLGDWGNRLAAYLIIVAEGILKDATGRIGEQLNTQRHLAFQA